MVDELEIALHHLKEARESIEKTKKYLDGVESITDSRFGKDARQFSEHAGFYASLCIRTIEHELADPK